MDESEFTDLLSHLGGPDEAARNLARLIARADEAERMMVVISQLVTERDASRAHVQELLGALDFVKEFFRKLEDGTDRDDPLWAIRQKYHAPLHARVDAALLNVRGPQPATQKRKESRWGKLRLI